MLIIQDRKYRYHNYGDREIVLLATDYDDDSNPKYYSYVSEDELWLIEKHDTTTKQVRYIFGKGSYETNWTNRASLSYDYYYNLF